MTDHAAVETGTYTRPDSRADARPDARPTKIMYVAEATAHGGRNGYITSQDGQIDLKVAMPPAMGGDGDGTNPEQLFAAGYSSCFHNALVLVGRRAGYDLTGSTVAAKVGIGPNKQRGYGLAVALSVSLPVIDQDIAAKLVDAAHQVCPYSNATRDNIEVSILLG
ncbi:organic hydroperoxide resistance protein [Streptomyces sp. NPDC057438]|uniref:organic hydroperoxide resistance protein n=1 Tax=Streptomyces sp. NPDC057438 TaxID=3346133 RepID=UPI003683F239